MAKIKSALKCQSFKYDFAVDGGAQSTIGMGIFLPECQLVGCTLLMLSDLAGGAGATLDIGTLGATASIISNTTLGAAHDYTDYQIAFLGFRYVNGALNGTVSSFIGNNFPILSTPADEVAVTISNANITGGAFICTVFYIEF